MLIAPGSSKHSNWCGCLDLSRPQLSGCSSSLIPSGCLSRCFRGSHPLKPSQPSDVDGSVAHKTPPPPDGKNANRGRNREDCPLREVSPQELPDTGFPGPSEPHISPPPLRPRLCPEPSDSPEKASFPESGRLHHPDTQS